MSIDRIGKSNLPVPTGVGEAKGPAPAASGEFRAEIAAASPASAPSLVDRVRKGEITVASYVDARVDAATEHLRGKLPAEQIAFVKTSLREQLASDPLLADLVRAAAGGLPPVEE